MKNLITNKTSAYFIIFISLCVSFSIKGQTTNQDSGDSLLQPKEYEKKILEYERTIFLSNNIKVKNEALTKKAEALKQINEFKRAAQTLERINEFELNEKELIENYFQKILLYYLSQDIDKAVSTIDNMYLQIDSTKLSKTNLLQALVYNEDKSYAKAKAKAIEYLQQTDQKEKISLIDSLYNHKPKLKSEKTAMYLSFLPGLGHIYAGYWEEGIASFLLNTGVIAFGAYEIYLKNYITAYLGAGGVLSGLYFGSYERAMYLTQKRNYINTNKFNTQIKEVLTSNYKSN